MRTYECLGQLLPCYLAYWCNNGVRTVLGRPYLRSGLDGQGVCREPVRTCALGASTEPTELTFLDDDTAENMAWLLNRAQRKRTGTDQVMPAR